MGDNTIKWLYHRNEEKMIKVQKLSYSYPEKDLYKNVSFIIEEDVHCAFIGTNGTGKSTFIDMIMNDEEYMYEGKIEISDKGRIGYVSQFSQLDEKNEVTVFQYISKEFVLLEQRIADLCKEMETSQELEIIFEEYQKALDESMAIDCDHYESNIKKKLKLANLEKLENQKIDCISGGEFKLVQVIKEMLLSPKLLIMDEPDVFLDFDHLNALRDLINGHKGTLLIITHNRYLLNNCFNKIIHLEGTDVQEFDGTYIEYNFNRLATKIEIQKVVAEEQAELERQGAIVNKARARATAMDNASLGRIVHARQTLLDRLEARQTEAPFVYIKQLDIHFEMGKEVLDENILTLKDYSLAFDEQLLEHVDFEMNATEKVAIVGKNGTGKTTLLREIFENSKESISINEDAEVTLFSQNGLAATWDGASREAKKLYNETQTLVEIMEAMGMEKESDIVEYLQKFGFEGETLKSRVGELSGGEKDLIQLAVISYGKSNFLLLDEPTGHLDVYAQVALEQAISEYKGAILMVSHDFYTVANCMDYVLFIEDNTVRKISIRKFRKMIYANHFEKDNLLLEQKKKEIETNIEKMLQKNELDQVDALMQQLEEIIRKW